MSPKTLPVVIAALFAAYAQAEEAKPPERNTAAETVEAEGKVSAVVVRGSRNTPRQSGDNYTVKGSTSAAKLDLKLKETPQSISVFTQQQMQDQNLKSLNDILEETPGITVINDSIPGVSDAEYYSRGFPVDNYQLDGVMVNKKMLGGRAAQDSFLYDRVEVVRGSTGLTTGAGDPAASINFVRKRPTAEKAGAFNLKYGSWNDKRIEFDYGGALNESKTLKGRLVSTLGHGGSFMDRVKQKSFSLYGVVDWMPNDNNILTVGLSRQHRNVRGAPRKGVSRYSQIMVRELSKEGYWGFRNEWQDERNTPPGFNNGANWAFDKQTTDNFFLEYKHFFTPNLFLQASYNQTHYKQYFRYGDMGTLAYAPKYNAATYEYGVEKNSYIGRAADIFLDGRFKLFNQEQQIIAGISGERADRWEQWGAGANPSSNLTNLVGPYVIAMMTGELVEDNFYLWGEIPIDYWNNGNFPMIAYTPYWKDDPRGPVESDYPPIKRKERRQYGPYFAFKFKPAKQITAVLGGRWLHYKNAMTKGWSEAGRVKKFVPYGGLIVGLAPNINAYASYTGIFKDNDGFPTITYHKRQMRGGGKFPPITGNSKEFGLKGEFFDNRLNFSLAYFTMLQKGYPTFEPVGWGKCEEWHRYVPDMCTRAALEYDTTTGYKSSGFDINIAGKITPKWLVNAGFTKLKIGKPYASPNSDSELGDELNMDYGETYTAPAKTFKFFTRYDFTPKFSAGIGMRWNSGVRPKPWGHGYSGGEYYVSNKPKELWQPAYAVWNAMASYKFGKNAAVAVNVGNIFNKRYYTNARGNFYGKPRNFSVALKMKW